mmetsp:Transcript_103688/g.270047  ORF Transcript_103688/g.270047 Transcript_103688/m.270047 type:complete len:272 (+) Transcript_103688:50-865(+)
MFRISPASEHMRASEFVAEQRRHASQRRVVSAEAAVAGVVRFCVAGHSRHCIQLVGHVVVPNLELPEHFLRLEDLLHLRGRRRERRRAHGDDEGHQVQADVAEARVVENGVPNEIDREQAERVGNGTVDHRELLGDTSHEPTLHRVDEHRQQQHRTVPAREDAGSAVAMAVWARTTARSEVPAHGLAGAGGLVPGTLGPRDVLGPRRDEAECGQQHQARHDAPHIKPDLLHVKRHLLPFQDLLGHQRRQRRCGRRPQHQQHGRQRGTRGDS